MKHLSLSAALVALSVVWSPMAWAAGDPELIAPSQQLKSGPNDNELSNFVAAFVRLIGVQHGYMMKFQDEQDPRRLERLKHAALSDMTAAVEQDGLSIGRYNEIALAVRENPDLQGRVEEILSQLASDPSAEQPAPEEE